MMKTLDFKHLDSTDKFVFLVGLCFSINIRLVGIFSLSEFLLLPLAFKYWNALQVDKNAKRLRNFAYLWVLGAVIANIVNNIDMFDSIKGIFFLLLFILLMPPIYHLLSDKPERILLFYLGTGISGLISPYVAQDSAIAEMLAADVYRFYAFAGFLMAIGGFLYFKGKRILAIVLIELISIVGLFNASRNLFLTSTLGAVVLLIMNGKKGALESKMAVFRKRIGSYFILGFIALMAVDIIYENLAANGTLGEAAYEKYIYQKQSGNIVKGGRDLTFMGLELVSMKPITGWGSYAKDTWGFRASYSYAHGMEYHDTGEIQLLPAHSIFVGSWMQNGILGAIFWIYVLIILWKVFKSGCLFCEPRVAGILVFKMMAFLWDWAFSAFGSRVTVLFLMMTLLVIYRNYQQGKYVSIQQHQQ